jgi:hypothetical protein
MYTSALRESSQGSKGNQMIIYIIIMKVIGTTRVVHCKKEPFDVYIGTPSKWGNPFKIGKDGSWEELIQKYRHWILANPGLMAQAPSELKGKKLGCWCKPNACHGDVLIELADETIWISYVIALQEILSLLFLGIWPVIVMT